jgi:hypothetical protein
MVLLKGAKPMLKLFLVALPFCTAFTSLAVAIEGRRLRLEQLRNRILNALEVSRG